MSVALGLGLAALGRPAYISLGRDHDLGPARERSVDLMRAHTHAMLEHAWAAGVRYVDVARSYGLAEQFLGEWLEGAPDRREQLTVGSKWGYRYVAGWRTDVAVHEEKDHTRATLDEQWPLTLASLGSYPDLYLIHSVTPESSALHDAALLDRLRGLAAEGVLVGLSTSGPRQGAVVEAALALADTPFRAVQSTVNLLEPSAAPALASAHACGWTVVAKEVFANGRLTRSDVNQPGPATALRARTGLVPETAALGWALGQPWLTIALTGAVTRPQLDANLEARPLTEEQLEDIAELAEHPEQYWATRSALPWV